MVPLSVRLGLRLGLALGDLAVPLPLSISRIFRDLFFRDCRPVFSRIFVFKKKLAKFSSPRQLVLQTKFVFWGSFCMKSEPMKLVMKVVGRKLSREVIRKFCEVRLQG